ncbi:MAG: Uncharacterized protein XD72_0552 [Methanothrix harundinacea]|uniref:Lon proteolytic domain-containing protein n=1 Tax=Methanothrix harundinacea TaxID=301375 RepID=A0A117MD21_9EURY|nr:MAG: Uncharacterized protein XD72_0552 [Methanothrix harundinacea]KUK97375.1 MAG: Uncharacterized protein XE07_0205 [Methanothrix harundinacea]
MIVADNKGLWLLFVLLLVNSYFIYDLNEQISELSRDIARPVDLPISDRNGQQNFSFTIAERSIPIVAVAGDDTGVMGQLNLRLIPGNNDILINTNPFLEPDIQYAIKKAVTYAESRDPSYKFDKDFVFNFNFSSPRADLVGGESAGAAAAILTTAALEGKDLKDDAVITGTINEDGSVGRIGGVLEKTKAVSASGYKNFLIPMGQSDITYYERQIQRRPIDSGIDVLISEYVPKTLDLSETAKDELGLNIIEVSDVEEALPYFIED